MNLLDEGRKREIMRDVEIAKGTIFPPVPVFEELDAKDRCIDHVITLLFAIESAESRERAKSQ